MAERRQTATHQMPATVGGQAGQPVSEGFGRNPAGNEAIRAQLGSSRGSLNILSTILRGPLPSHISPNPNPAAQEAQEQNHQAFIRDSSRCMSPLRVITSSSAAPSDPKTISPSRTPLTLPPKKSLSPSRSLYTDGQSPQQPHQRFQQPSSPQKGHPISRGPPPYVLSNQTLQPAKPIQGEIPQAILQQLPAETVFQQYKIEAFPELQGVKGHVKEAVSEGVTREMMVLAQQAADSAPRVHTQILFERQSPGSAQTQPKPAHQAEMRLTPPTYVTTIRRTPSPAHMPVGAESKAVRPEAVAGDSEKQQAVNLSKPHERHTSGGWIHQPQPHNKPLLESRMSEEFKYGDLLQSIQRSQDIQSQLLQRGLSPITPSDTQEPPKSWASEQEVISQATMTQHQRQNRNKDHLSESQGQPFMISPGFIPISMSIPIPVSALQTTALSRPAVSSQVVFPSHGQKLASPKAQKVEPTGTILHHAALPKSRLMHNLSVYGQSDMEKKQSVVSLVRLQQGHGEAKGTVKVFPGLDRSKMQAQPLLASVTEPGPPNVTITTSCSIFPPEKTLHAQRMIRNPFTFPVTSPLSAANEFTPVGRVFQMDRSKFTADTADLNKKQKPRDFSEDMPCLVPVSPYKEKKDEDQLLIPIPQPYNMRLQILANLPSNSTYRPTYRATTVAVHRAKAGCITSAARSLDILRQNLQKSINKDIQEVLQKYIDKFFEVGIENIKLNNGENSVSEEHMQAVCRQILEEAKKMYTSESGRRSMSPARELSDNVSETGSNGRRSALGRKRHPSDTDSEKSIRAPGIKKKKGRHLLSVTGRSTPSKLSKEVWKREGPKYDPERLTESCRFVMGSKANKAMGFGATRGRLYMKHPDLFKYNGDQDDKTWLYEHHHMPATGGKSYLVVLDDIKELAQTEEYINQPGISIMDITGFCVPLWMIEKMRHQMMAMRTDLPKLPKHRSRSVTPNDGSTVSQEVENGADAPKELPFANFSSPKTSRHADDDLEFLAVDEPSPRLSPFNMTGGFEDGASDLDTLEEDSMIQ